MNFIINKKKKKYYIIILGERLGINGVAEIKAHPFFFGIDWKKIQDKQSPYVPEVNNYLFNKNTQRN